MILVVQLLGGSARFDVAPVAYHQVSNLVFRRLGALGICVAAHSFVCRFQPFGGCLVYCMCHAVRTRKEEKKKVMSFYLRAGGACFLYTHCQALPAPAFRFRRCAASVFAGPLSSGQVPIRRGVSGKVLFRHGAGRHPAVLSKHTPPRNYLHSYARFRVTITPNFGCRPRCP